MEVQPPFSKKGKGNRIVGTETVEEKGKDGIYLENFSVTFNEDIGGGINYFFVCCDLRSSLATNSKSLRINYSSL